MKKNYIRISRILAAVLVIVMVISMTIGCAKKDEVQETAAAQTEKTGEHTAEAVKKAINKAPAVEEEEPETWAIYMYVCGSNLEEEGAEFTDNVGEILPEDMPDNLTIVMQTGGAKEWWNEEFDPDYLERWEITHDDGLQCIQQLPLDSTGDPDVLEDFLVFCRDNYDADRKMLLFWDHGGGTLYGFGGDSNYAEHGSMSITEMENAVENALGADFENPPLDILMYDCCLMATVDIAERFADVANYLIASEQSMPGSGSDYEVIATALAYDPYLSPEEYGREIVDGFIEKQIKENAANITCSLTDLSRIYPVTLAIDDFGAELLKEMYKDEDYFREIVLAAQSTENYGVNVRNAGFFNLIDAGNFAENVRDYLGSNTADDLIDAIDEAVVYHREDEVMSSSRGLSMYFPYDADEYDLESFLKNGVSQSYKSIYSIDTIGKLYDEEQKYVASLGLDPVNVPNIPNFDRISKYNPEVKKNKAGEYYADFGTEAWRCTTNILENLFLFDGDDLYSLGTDDEVEYDDEGIIVNKFGGNWFALNGHLVTADLSFDSDEKNIYVIPVMLQEGFDKIKTPKEDPDAVFGMQIMYDAANQEWTYLGILGLGADPGESRGITLEDNQVISILRRQWDDEDSLNIVDSCKFGDLEWSVEPLPDGEYAMCFILEDVQKNTLWSDYFYFNVKKGVLKYE